MNDLKYWIWLSSLNLKPIEKVILVEKYGNPKNIYNSTKRDFLGFSEVIIDEIFNRKKRNIYEEKINLIKEKNIEVINCFDDRYPKKLRNIYGYPVVLYTRGNLNLLNAKKSVSIVGCRDCSDYGREVAYRLGINLAKNDIVVVSGMAKGIDYYSHLGSIKINSKTIAVLGSGVDYIYPPENENIYKKIIQNGGLIISEFLPGEKPQKYYFPLRNRIISGLSDITVVVEAGKHSGSLITADIALEQGREVYVVPGNLMCITSEGTNNLIKEGAPILTCPEDIINALKEW